MRQRGRCSRVARHAPCNVAASVLAMLVAIAACTRSGDDGRASAARPAAATSAAAGGELESFDFAGGVLPAARLAPLSLTELRRLRGVVFGRHGRVFEERDIQAYLERQPWYAPDVYFKNYVLTANERANLDLIREAEARRHDHIEPGDMRFYLERPLTARMLGRHTTTEWRVLRAEVLAEHGRRFGSDEELDEYFRERYWYRPADDDIGTPLSSVEMANLDTMLLAEARQNGRAVAPGMMGMMRDSALTPASLGGLGIHELRLLRNEIYARRGRAFATPWLRAWAWDQPWYRPNPQFDDSSLGAIERRNIATIVAREAELHEQLATTPVDTALLAGLYVDDARRLRNEIYARHGRTFADRSLQAYFASFAWYRPDRAFRESSLNEIERRNVATIAEFEQRATRFMQETEG